MTRSEELLNRLQLIIGDCSQAIEEVDNQQYIAFRTAEETEQRRVEMLEERLKEIKLSIQKTLNR